MSGPEAGLYTAFVEPNDLGAFGLVGAGTGLVVAAGGVVWDGTGAYWRPTEWKEPGNLVCTTQTVRPATIYLDSGRCDDEDGGMIGATAEEALDLVLSTNLASGVATLNAFSAFTYLYTPRVGWCSPWDAVFLVVLTTAR